MIKVKIFEADTSFGLEKLINKFADEYSFNKFDVQYSCFLGNDGFNHYTCVITYN